MHGDYHNALEQIDHLELINKEKCNESDEIISAMGKDMGKVIRMNKDLKRKIFKIKNRAINNYSSWKNMQSGDGVKKTFFKTKAPSILQIGRSVSLAPSTIYVYNNGKVQYRGHRIPLGCSCLMTTTLPEAILPTLPTQYFGGRATG